VLQMADVTFTAESSIWRTVDAWAKHHGYRLIEWETTGRVYEKSHRVLRGFGRWRVDIETHGHAVELGADVRFRHLSPPGPGRESFIERARADVNQLLEDLGQPPLPTVVDA
jgi:hypothetical protein